MSLSPTLFTAVVVRSRALLLVLLTLLCTAVLQAKDEAKEFPLPTFEEEVIDLFSRLPVQDDGRVKPLGTKARFSLLPLIGRTKVDVGVAEDGSVRSFLKPADKKAFDGAKHTYTASEWLLLCFLHPTVADSIPVFVVNDSDAIRRIGAEMKRKRDVYSYDDLKAQQQSLVEQTREVMGMEDRERNRIDDQIMALGQNVLSYQRLTAYMAFAREGLSLGDGEIPDYFGADAEGRVSVSNFLAAIPELRKSMADSSADYLREATFTIQRYLGQTDPANVDLARADAVDGKWDDVLGRIEPFAGLASAVQLLPPPPATGEGLDPQLNQRWFTPSNAILTGLLFDNSRQWSVDSLRLIEDVEAAKNDPASLKAALTALSESTRAVADARGEISQLDREVKLYEGRYFNKALVYFIFGFVLVALTWVAPQAKWARILSWIGLIAVVGALYYLCAGVTHRCIIRNRPPITNLYETILFITACAVILCLFMEWMNRQRIALSTATVLGAGGMFLAIRFEAGEATDTMPTLVAVLRSNFWLWTHVTVITLAYACGLLAAALSHIYIIGRVLRIGDPRGDFYKSVTRMVYGIICFCLITSLIGTVLGGIWANYSWGRFWGWDPKENGALMIVLGAMIILHARLGGFIKDLGVHMSSILLGCAVSFSWWGVNNLGIGLHSYGFTSGVWKNLYTAWAVEAFVLLLGVIVWFASRKKKANGPKPPATEAA